MKAILALAALASFGCSHRDQKDYTFDVRALPGEIQLERIDQIITGERSDGARFCKYFYIRGKITTTLASNNPATAMSTAVRSVADLRERCGFLALHPEGLSFFGEIQKLLGTEVKFFRQNSGHFETYASMDGTGMVVVVYSGG